jgi:DNA-binding HxlR family transcriptional regulator
MPKGRDTREAATPVDMVLTDVEQLKVIGDAFRLQVIEAMAEDPRRTWTAKELAAHLGVKQTKLYHHLELLERHGFIRVASTRVVSGIVERRFQATAHGFRVDHTLVTGSGSQAAVSTAVDAIFRKARQEILESMASGAIPGDLSDPNRKRMGLWATHARLSPASVRRVMRLVEKLAVVDSDQDPDGDEYGLVVGVYPRTTRS